MTAPSLVLLGNGSPDPRVAQVSHRLRDELLAIRPELDVHVGFLEHGGPSGMSVVHRLVGQGVTEIVLVPLLLSTLDARLRAALGVRGVTELDALVSAAAGSPAARSNARVARGARQWATH